MLEFQEPSDQPDPKDYRDLLAFLEASVLWGLQDRAARQVPRGILGRQATQVQPGQLGPRAQSVP